MKSDCLRYRGSIHINLAKEVITGYQSGMKVFKGTYNPQVKLLEASEMDLAVTKEPAKMLEYKI
jgi:hypothetical protein